MICLYMNNFRGFRDAVVPLRQVNFLVGENSTGKSSVLALLELLSSPNFFMGLDFNAGSYEFGGYDDLVSAGSLDRREFQVGMCMTDGDSQEVDAAYLMHFKKGADGLPVLVRMSALSASFLTSIRIAPRLAYVYQRKLPAESASPFYWPETFGALRLVPERLKSGYKIVPPDLQGFVRRSLAFSLGFVADTVYESVDMMTQTSPTDFPNFRASLAAMAPIRTRAKRTYDGYAMRFSSGGEHTPYVIRRVLSAPDRPGSKTVRDSLETFGKESGLFRGIGVTQFGDGSAAPFEVTVTLDQVPLRVNSVGYGVSQSLPVVVELLTHGRESWLALQQPEVHLHPRAQAALGDVLFKSAVRDGHHLFVETHSDYLLDRFRMNVRDTGEHGGIAQVLFFERTAEGNSLSVMQIGEDGAYPSEQPEGFRHFFLQEQRRILGI